MRVRWSWAPVALGALGLWLIGSGVGHRGATPPADLAVAVTGSQLGIVTTVAHNAAHTVVTSVPVGGKVHVKATVTGAFGVATGTVQARVYANGTCSGFMVGESNPVALSSGIADITAFTYSSKDGGAMSWIVHYNGDATYAGRDGACVKVTITKIDPSAAMVIHNPAHQVVTEVPLGTSAHPKVTMTGSQGVPTGSLELYFWKNGNCFGTAFFSASPYNLVGGAVDASGFARPSDETGAHSMRAHYLGNSTYNAFWGPCVQYDIVKATPVVYLNVHEPSHDTVQFLPLGDPVHTAVSLSGPVGTPTGTVQIWGYDTDNCTGGAVTQSVTAAATIDPATTNATRSSPGYKSWIARYLGDARYAARNSACTKVRWMPVPTITGVVHDAAHHAVTTVAPGTEVHLKVTATGGYGTVTGTVNVYVYTSGTCNSGANKNEGGMTLSSGVADDASIHAAPTTPGKYFLVPVYLQGPTYIGTIGPCVPFTVANPPTPTPAPTPTPKPTPKPSATPKPTTTPNATPTPAPATQPAGTQAAATGSPAPSSAPTDGTTQSSAPGPTTAPPASGVPSAPAEGSSPPVTTAPGSTPSAQPTPTGDGGAVPMILLIILIVVAVAVFIGWRSRRPGRT